jgi:hypothetical protein
MFKNNNNVAEPFVVFDSSLAPLQKNNNACGSGHKIPEWIHFDADLAPTGEIDAAPGSGFWLFVKFIFFCKIEVSIQGDGPPW